MRPLEDMGEVVVAHVGLTAQKRIQGSHPHGRRLQDQLCFRSLEQSCGLDWKFDAMCLHVVTAWRMFLVWDTCIVHVLPHRQCPEIKVWVVWCQ